VSFRKAAEMQPIVVEFLSFSNPIPVFLFLPRTQPSSSNLYLQLTPLFQFFSIQSCKLGGQKTFLRRIFAAGFFAAGFSLSQ